MSDAQEKLGTPTGMGPGEEQGKVGKKNFTPPVLHKYGEVVKICQDGPKSPADDALTFAGFS